MINLHAAAKPLMRWMYDRQAMEFIRKNKGHVLSTVTVEIYMSYLGLEPLLAHGDTRQAFGLEYLIFHQ
jgi:hypothetical protein